jgi:hypothetical protein
MSDGTYEQCRMEQELKKLSPFDFINSINEGQSGKNLMQDCTADVSASLPDPFRADRQYVPFMVNRGLSYFNDTILFANEMNMHASLPAKMQYDFLKGAIRPRKRFSKWSKKADDNADIKNIMTEYDYSAEKARQILPLFTQTQLETLKTKHDVGGTGKTKNR